MSELDDRRSVRTERRAQLGAFLKSRRAKITPGEVGLAPGPRRRTPGLRREEVAQLSGIGITWYTWLEQGRPINASTQVLDAVSRTLRLDQAEKAHLYSLADLPTAPIEAVAEATIPPGVPLILDQLDPLPAVLVSPKFDVLARNDAYRTLFPCFTDNVLRRVFTTPDCCNPYVHNADDLRRMVAYLRGAYAKRFDDPTWQGLVNGLCTDSTAFAALWASNDVAVPISLIKQARHLAIGSITLHLTNLSLPLIDGAWVQIFTPVDEVQGARLTRLLAMSDEHRRAVWIDHVVREHGVGRPVPVGLQRWE
ncbi:helix-turn-helix transcriptional regulator [Nocardia salmonicida]|uniref:helix-turn-helix transcriptional regulator n=1 Tax=Nocardia salmonicida TaxID=53431 RepID=UPI003791BED9